MDERDSHDPAKEFAVTKARQLGQRYTGTTIIRKILVAGIVALLVASIWLLGWLYIHHHKFRDPPDYFASTTELLLTLVIAIEGLVAVFAFEHDERLATNASNVEVLQLYQLYLSVDYHRNVRRPAWFAISKAGIDPEYRKLVLGGLAGLSSGEDIGEGYALTRGTSFVLPADPKMKEIWLAHDEYHRVQDILGFFTMLASVSGNADSEVLESCNFFYDRWFVQLHWIISQLNSYELSDSTESTLKARRVAKYSEMLETLDRRFGLTAVRWQDHPLVKRRLL